MVALNGTAALNGGKVVVKDASGKAVASCCVTGGDCRGGQCGLAPRFVLAPGAYKVEFIGPDGKAVGEGRDRRDRADEREDAIEKQFTTETQRTQSEDRRSEDGRS